ncbi:NAD-dependent epimerase/dehydratase family protein [Kineococcus sp. R86509]|uniref:NAD-dependent epimerase/dehydratase family protein n=1 Tax=Kineococcus sp. R86509 TaxID=3093851 RepID=UPI0036D2ACAF
MPTRVLVTGGSGFIAGHCILQLLAEGHEVRTTIRSPGREAAVRAVLQGAGTAHGEDLTFVAADLLEDAGWADATAGIDTVVHVASPVRPGHVEDEDDLIVPAREGTLRVLAAARDAGVRRIVLTSAFHAVSWGHPHDDHVFTEEDWTVLDGPGVDAYGRSKTLAERAAWEFAAANGLDLVTLLPVAVMGPVVGQDVSGANQIVQRLLTGAVPALPHLFFPIVDVRDVAAAHVLAVGSAEAAGQRFLLSDGPTLEFPEIAAILRSALGADADRVPTQVLPNDVVRAGADADPALRAMVPDLGYAKRTSNEKARRVLGWAPRPASEAVEAAGRSMVERGLV